MDAEGMGVIPDVLPPEYQPITSRKELVERVVNSLGNPEVRGKYLCWNITNRDPKRRR